MLNRRPIKYLNLFREMAGKGETMTMLGKLLGVGRDTISRKLSGRAEWTIGEIEIICNHYNKDYYELFK